MIDRPLVLSLFPGIGLLDMAFEEEGFCVVRGPDVLWGGDARRFHPTPWKFDGVIGGPPCQRFSPLNQAGRMGLQELADDLIPEFERIVEESKAGWFLMENVEQAPMPRASGYGTHALVVNNRWCGGVQNRRRRFTFGICLPGYAASAFRPDFEPLMPAEYAPCVTANGTQWEPNVANGGRSRSDRSNKALANYIRWQGLPADFLSDAPFTVEGKVRVVGNGVPLTMGRTVARAVRKAIGLQLEATA